MSEKETIEERYENVKRLKGLLNFPAGNGAIDLLDDLMAERGKMKENIEILKKLLVQEVKETQVTDARFIEP